MKTPDESRFDVVLLAAGSLMAAHVFGLAMLVVSVIHP